MYFAFTIPDYTLQTVAHKIFTRCVSHLVAFTAQECENPNQHANTREYDNRNNVSSFITSA